MKSIFNLLFLLNSFLYYSQEKISYDEHERLISEVEFQEKWRNKSNNLYRWDYLENNKRICTLKEGQIQYPEFDYYEVTRVLEKKLDVVFSKNAVIVIDFWYYNDICSNLRDDKWSSLELREWKEFSKNSIKEVEKKLKENGQELFVFYVFEKNSIVNKKNTDYFKSFLLDSDNFFRDNYFKEKAMCGQS